MSGNGDANPAGLGGWAATNGQDFIYDHQDRNIDFATTHLWPENWDILGSDSGIAVRSSAPRTRTRAGFKCHRSLGDNDLA